MPSTAHARPLRDPPPAPPPPARDLLNAARASRQLESMEQASLVESKVAIVSGVAAVAATLASIVWLLATINANVAALRQELPPGSIPTINATLVSIDGRLERLEDTK